MPLPKPVSLRQRHAPATAPRRLLGALFLCAAMLMALPASGLRAQTILRDPDIEYSLARLARPILNAAGLSPAQVKIIVLKDSSLNAFVVDGRAIFIHSGLILKLDTPGELQAVIAHEAAHIANGHISRRLADMRSARTAAGLGLILSAVAAGAGGADAGAGLALGTTSAAQRAFLAHTRAEESAADQSSARYLANAGVDPEAMVRVLEMFRGQEALSVSHQDPYALTHPLTRERLTRARAYAAALKPRGKGDREAAYWFARARGKLGAFIRSPGWALSEAKKAPSRDIALMMQAVAWHRIPKQKKAIAAIGELARMRPKDPFIHELRGQILLESRHVKDAVRAYAQARALAPRSPLIAAGYGRALLAFDTPEANRKALAVLEKAHASDPRDPALLRDLALAHARAGQPGRAALATAERLALTGHLRDAALHARRAADQLPRGSPAWRRAQDILTAARQAKKRR